MSLPLLVNGDPTLGLGQSLGALFYSGIELNFMQPKPSSYLCAKGRHSVDWLCRQAPSPVTARTVLLAQLVRSLGPRKTSAVFHYFASCFSWC